MSDGVPKKWQKALLQVLSKSPRYWGLLSVALGSICGTLFLTHYFGRQFWKWRLLQQYSSAKKTRIQDLPPNVDQLKAICLSTIQENKALLEQVRSRDRELSTQRQSLANLALTVVKQDRHIKTLLGHINISPEKRFKERRAKGFDQDTNPSETKNHFDLQSLSQHFSQSGLSGGLVHSTDDEADKFEEPEIFEDATSYHEARGLMDLGEEEDDEVSQMKQQILEASDFLNDLANDEEIVQVSNTSSNGTHYSSSISTSTRGPWKRQYSRWNSLPNTQRSSRQTFRSASFIPNIDNKK